MILSQQINDTWKYDGISTCEPRLIINSWWYLMYNSSINMVLAGTIFVWANCCEIHKYLSISLCNFIGIILSYYRRSRDKKLIPIKLTHRIMWRIFAKRFAQLTCISLLLKNILCSFEHYNNINNYVKRLSFRNSTFV